MDWSLEITDKIKKRETWKNLEKYSEAHKDVSRWMSKIPSKKSRYYYIRGIKRFCECFKIDGEPCTPEKLMELSKEDKRKGDVERERMLDDFCRELIEKELIFKSDLWQISKAVKSFFKHNYYPISSEAGKVEVSYKKQKRPTKEEIKEFIKVGGLNFRDTALIYFTSSYCLRISEVPRVLWGDIQGLQTDEFPYIEIDDKRLKGGGKGRYKGTVMRGFLFPSARKILLKYLTYLEKKLGRSIQPTDPLFFTEDAPYHGIDAETIAAVMKRAQKRSEIHLKFHDLRRYYTGIIDEVGSISEIHKKLLTGHKLGGIDRSYSLPTTEELRTSFKKMVTYLDLELKPEEIMTEIRKALAPYNIPENVLEATAEKIRKMAVGLITGILIDQQREAEDELGRKQAQERGVVVP